MSQGLYFFLNSNQWRSQHPIQPQAPLETTKILQIDDASGVLPSSAGSDSVLGGDGRWQRRRRPRRFHRLPVLDEDAADSSRFWRGLWRRTATRRPPPGAGGVEAALQMQRGGRDREDASAALRTRRRRGGRDRESGGHGHDATACGCGTEARRTRRRNVRLGIEA